MFLQIKTGAFIKNPVTSELGIRIVQSAISLLNEIGFDEFNFRKLAQQLHTSETSIYRYFESKMQLLNFLSQWYWFEVKEEILEEIIGLILPEEKIERAIEILCNPNGSSEDENPFFNLSQIHQLMIQESFRPDLWGENNQKDDHASQKRLIQYLSEVILTINPNYSYPKTLVSVMIHSCHNQLLFSTHLPYFSDIPPDNLQSLVNFIKTLTLSTIKNDTV